VLQLIENADCALLKVARDGPPYRDYCQVMIAPIHASLPLLSLRLDKQSEVADSAEASATAVVKGEWMGADQRRGLPGSKPGWVYQGAVHSPRNDRWSAAEAVGLYRSNRQTFGPGQWVDEYV